MVCGSIELHLCTEAVVYSLLWLVNFQPAAVRFTYEWRYRSNPNIMLKRSDPAQELDGDGLMRLCTSPRARVLRRAASESESEREKAERAPGRAGLRTSAAPAHEEAEGRRRLAREIALSSGTSGTAACWRSCCRGGSRRQARPTGRHRSARSKQACLPLPPVGIHQACLRHSWNLFHQGNQMEASFRPAYNYFNKLSSSLRNGRILTDRFKAKTMVTESPCFSPISHLQLTAWCNISRPVLSVIIVIIVMFQSLGFSHYTFE